MHIFKDIIDFIKTLTVVDYVFFFAVILLLVLIITLVYFIKSNNEVFIETTASSNDSNEIKDIAQKLEIEKPRVEFTPYEKDQEDKAIISYEELVQKSKTGQINYEEEKDLEGLSVKKINLDETITDTSEETPISEVRVISYQNEENFLQALKKLQSLLN
jgi:hypothetical protein